MGPDRRCDPKGSARVELSTFRPRLVRGLFLLKYENLYFLLAQGVVRLWSSCGRISREWLGHDMEWEAALHLRFTKLRWLVTDKVRPHLELIVVASFSVSARD